MFNVKRTKDVSTTIVISAKDLINSGVTTTTTNDLFFTFFVAFYNNKINALFVRRILSGIIVNPRGNNNLQHILKGIIVVPLILIGIVFLNYILKGIIIAHTILNGIVFLNYILVGIIVAQSSWE